MRTRPALPLVLVAVLLLGAAPAVAGPVTFNFYLEIDVVNLPSGYDFVEYYGPAVGDRFAGSLGFDDGNVPASGTYTIGHSVPCGLFRTCASYDEVQAWSLNMPHPFPGQRDGFNQLNSDGYALTFMDGKLIGLDWDWSTDVFGVDYLDFARTGGFGYGVSGAVFAGFYGEAGEVLVRDQVRYDGGGSLHFVPDAGSSLLLLGMGLAGLGAWRRRWQ